jgi:hypothetical protein
VNSVLLVPQVFLMFCVRPTGAWLIATALLAIAIYGVELADTLCERDSRAQLGGLTSIEYAMHFFMGATRAVYVGAYFALTSLADYMRAASLGESPWWLRAAGWCVLVPAVLVAVLHVALAVRGRVTAA